MWWRCSSRRLAPAQINIALQAIEQLEQVSAKALQQQWEQQLEQARYEVQLAQSVSTMPSTRAYRLVAAELERRWNDKLKALQTLEHAYARSPAAKRVLRSAPRNSGR